MRQYFSSSITRPYAFRKMQLVKLRNAIRKNETAIHEALFTDLKKSPEECWVTETGFLLAEISNTIKQLKRWMQDETVPTNLVNFPSKSFVRKEPLGVVLIIGPWNYPLQLLFTPLAGAIAAGNTVVVKASEHAPATAAVMKKIIEETFDPAYILFTEGDGATVIPAMMNAFTFDHVFYTGSTAVGKIIYKMAAERLVPVTLELGGKSPCIVEEDADITVAARRIAMAKFSNVGQMCVAPDYVLVQENRKEQLLTALQKAVQHFFKGDAATSYEYGKIINERQFDRLAGYLSQGKIIFGGRTDKSNLFIEPTVLTEVPQNAPVMSEEIFGPVLPVIGFSSDEEAKKIIAENPNPLAFYVFSGSKRKQEEWLNAIPFGGGCLNNTALHLTNHHLPFGGKGFSGTGNYHGKYSFDTFSHKKGIMRSPTWFDPMMKYPPFKGKLKLLKWLIK